MAPKMWGQTKIYRMGEVVKYKSFAVVRKTQNERLEVREDYFEVRRGHKNKFIAKGFHIIILYSNTHTYNHDTLLHEILAIR